MCSLWIMTIILFGRTRALPANSMRPSRQPELGQMPTGPREYTRLQTYESMNAIRANGSKQAGELPGSNCITRFGDVVNRFIDSLCRACRYHFGGTTCILFKAKTIACPSIGSPAMDTLGHEPSH